MKTLSLVPCQPLPPLREARLINPYYTEDISPPESPLFSIKAYIKPRPKSILSNRINLQQSETPIGVREFGTNTPSDELSLHI